MLFIIMQFTNLSEDEKIVYNYWKKIPAISSKPSIIRKRIIESEVREIMIKIFSEGIRDDLFGVGEKLIRHAFTSKELLKMINARLPKKVKLPNIYFHLDKMMEYDLIYVVSEIPDGKYTRRYFGRKAKLFIFSGDPQEEEDYEKLQGIQKILEKLNPKSDDKLIHEKLNYLIKDDQQMQNKVIEWFEKNSDNLLGLDIDTFKLYTFITMLFFRKIENPIYDDVCNLFKIDEYL